MHFTSKLLSENPQVKFISTYIATMGTRRGKRYLSIARRVKGVCPFARRGKGVCPLLKEVRGSVHYSTPSSGSAAWTLEIMNKPRRYEKLYEFLVLIAHTQRALRKMVLYFLHSICLFHPMPKEHVKNY